MKKLFNILTGSVVNLLFLLVVLGFSIFFFFMGQPMPGMILLIVSVFTFRFMYWEWKWEDANQRLADRILVDFIMKEHDRCSTSDEIDIVSIEVSDKMDIDSKSVDNELAYKIGKSILEKGLASFKTIGLRRLVSVDIIKPEAYGT